MIDSKNLWQCMKCCEWQTKWWETQRKILEKQQKYNQKSRKLMKLEKKALKTSTPTSKLVTSIHLLLTRSRGPRTSVQSWSRSTCPSGRKTSRTNCTTGLVNLNLLSNFQPTYSEIRTPRHRAPVDAPDDSSSIESRIEFLFSLRQGISTSRMECGGFLMMVTVVDITCCTWLGGICLL